MKTQSLLLALLVSVVVAGCDSKAPQPPLASPKPAPTGSTPASPHSGTPAATASAPASSTAPAASATDPVVSLLGVNVKLPDGWKRNPPANQMRLAEADVPDASGDATKTCLVVFSTAGGSVEENIARWGGQMRDASGQPVAPQSATKTVDGLKITSVSMSGSFSGMGGGAPKDNWALHGAIIETPQGLLFIKMTGPAASMQAAAKAFDAMLDGVKKS